MTRYSGNLSFMSKLQICPYGRATPKVYVLGSGGSERRTYLRMYLLKRPWEPVGH